MLLARLFSRRNCRSSSRSRRQAGNAPTKHSLPSDRPYIETLEDRRLLSGWAIGIGGSTSFDQGNSVATDSAGNVYVAGNFSGTVDFDPGPGTFNLTSLGGAADVYVAKYSSSGALMWARRAGSSADGVTGRHIATDSAGNVYMVGYFAGTADFGSTTLVSNGGFADTFVAKLDSSGTLLWARGVGGSGSDYGNGVAVDGSGNVYATGGFENAVDFDPGPGTYNLTSTGGREMFALKLDTNGSFVWAQRAGGSDSDQGMGAALDAGGNVYFTGFYQSPSADFGATILSPASRDIFVTKLDGATGGFMWADGFGGVNSDMTLGGTAVDGYGNVYATGSISGPGADLDPGPGTFTICCGGAFVSKLDTNGNFVWAKGFQGTYSGGGNDLALDSSGNVYTAGNFGDAAGRGGSATVDFDPGPGTAFLTETSGSNIFISKLDSAGNFLAARKMDVDTPGNSVDGIVIDATGNIYMTGQFGGSAYFDIGTTTSNASSNAGSWDIFVVKTTQETPTTPQLSRLLDSPDPATKNGPLTLTANDLRVVAGGSNVASVSFYRDKNDNGTLEVGTDTLLGTDTNGSNGWSLTTTAASKNSITSYFAQAKDSSNVVGNVVSARNRVGPGGPVAAMVATRDTRTSNVDAAIASHYNGDHDSYHDLLQELAFARHLRYRLRRLGR